MNQKPPHKPFRPDFLLIPIQLYEDPRIEPTDRDVYAVVYWYEHLKDGECRASNQAISQILSGASTRAVQNSLTKLEDTGYISREYKDEAKRNRLRIVTKIAMKYGQNGERSGGDRQKSSEVLVTRERSVGDRASEVLVTRVRIGSKNRSNTSGPEPARVDEVAEVIHAFEAINPAVKKMYGNKTQRKACQSLIAEYGFTATLQCINQVLPKTNAIPFFPTITTPLQLEEGWAKLKAAITRHRAKNQNNKANIAFV